jgi:23S rRNA (cytidine1920-2'-O)/16S rRNA (cytidine1409-2'-O)-methyltransferase
MARTRLDQLLVDRGLAPSRERARSMVMAGYVQVAQRRVLKPGIMVTAEAALQVVEPQPYVSRGGIKLAHALDTFGIDPAGLTCLDVGASTGGFTDCLLKRGARKVYAVDVGHGQIDYGLRIDPRVEVREGMNVRRGVELSEVVDLATIDVSFISLELIIPPTTACLTPDGTLVALVKPQFEIGRYLLPKGGVVRDPKQHAQVLSRLVNWLVNQTRLRIAGLTPSPILGDAGNREFFLWLKQAA